MPEESRRGVRPLWTVLGVIVAFAAGGAVGAVVSDGDGDLEGDGDQRTVIPGSGDGGERRGHDTAPSETDSVEHALSLSAARRPCPDFDTAPPVEAVADDYQLEKLGDFTYPTWVAVHPDTGWEVVVERAGRVVDLDTGETLLDLTGTTRAEHDGGALTAVFDPDGDWLYLYRSTDDGDTPVTRLTAHAVDADAGTIATEGTTIIQLVQPSAQHDGGGLAFGPDGNLWMALGDGGGLGDPWPNAQDPTTLLGSLLRIDPVPEEGGYAIPEGNDPDAPLPEVWATGLRNPWRLSFDGATGAMFLVDVGQTCWEELNIEVDPLATLGANFGWDLYEGFEPFQTPPLGSDEEPELTDPDVAYRHGAGRCAAIGGLVYDGDALPDLSRAYLWGDFCGSDAWAMRQDDSGAWSIVELGVEVSRLLAVVADADGEPLLVSGFTDAETEEGGAVYRLVPD